MERESFRPKFEVKKPFKDYYAILGVSPDAGDDEIKSAFRTLAKKTHPDIPGNKYKEEDFKNIGEAYKVLSDARKRREYNLKFKTELKAGASTSDLGKQEPTLSELYQKVVDAQKNRLRAEEELRQTEERQRNFMAGLDDKTREQIKKYNSLAKEQLGGKINIKV